MYSKCSNYLKCAVISYLCQGPYRHYVLNAIWILINLLAIMLTIFHLRYLYYTFLKIDCATSFYIDVTIVNHYRKLYKDFTKTNIEALRVHRLFSLAVKSEKQARY